MSASDGLKLLATHLAEVKLQAAESNYELNCASGSSRLIMIDCVMKC